MGGGCHIISTAAAAHVCLCREQEYRFAVAATNLFVEPLARYKVVQTSIHSQPHTHPCMDMHTHTHTHTHTRTRTRARASMIYKHTLTLSSHDQKDGFAVIKSNL